MSHEHSNQISQVGDQSLPKLPPGYCRTLANLSSPLQDKYLRSVADFRNLQERTKRDIAAARDFAIQRFATDLIESIDNLDRALGSVPPEALSPDSPSSPQSTTSNTSSPSSPNVATSEEAASEADALNRDLLNLHAGLK